MSKKLSEMSLEELWQLFPIYLTEHDERWSACYAEEELTLKKHLSVKWVKRISHIGSTAVKGIWAKPIIDILVEVIPESDLQQVKPILEKAGYLCMSESSERLSFNKGYTENGFAERVFHLHLRKAGDNDELYFRDYLNIHPDVAKEYEKLKLSLWKQYEHNRDGYTKRKTAFVKEYTQKARAEFEDRYAANSLLENLDALHTTELGVMRIKRNLSLDTDDVIDWCKAKIKSADAVITRNGKNWYVNVDNCIITVNAYSYTIITAHKKAEKKTKYAEVIMDSFVDERDYKILENDKYTFFVLGRIMGGKCKLLLTDHERLIICFTSNPYPVWIWTPDDASEEDMERAYQLAAEHCLLDGEHRFNLKYDLANYFIKRSAEDDKKMSISLNMYAYDCPELVKPTVIADGSIHQCNSDDLDELVDFLDLFHKETGIDQNDRDVYRLQAEANIDAGNMYFWKDKYGNNVASCKYGPNGDMAGINLVFTRHAFRRKHYAENLVYQVTKLAMEAGYIPMLYTDADYAASNACYEKIGYVLKGKLCTIG